MKKGNLKDAERKEEWRHDKAKNEFKKIRENKE